MGALLAMVMTVNAQVEAAYLALIKAQGTKLDAPHVGQLTLKQDVFPDRTFVFASGFNNAGHERLQPVVFIVEAHQPLRVLRVTTKNLDEAGTHQRLERVTSCNASFDLEWSVASRAMDMKRLAPVEARRARECVELLPALEVAAARAVEPVALFVATLVMEAPSLVPLTKLTDMGEPRLLELFKSMAPGPTMGPSSWVGSPKPFTPWKTTSSPSGWSGQGMVLTQAGPPKLHHVVASFANGHLALECQWLAFVREFIE